MTANTVPVEQPYAESFEDSIYRKVNWRIIPLFIACFLFAYLDRVNISFAKLQMQSDLGFSETVYGLGASLFFVGYFLFEVPSNMLLHKIGARVWIARIMVTWGITSACMMFVQNEFWFYTLRFLIGVMEAGFVPGVLYFFTQWYPGTRRARVNSYFKSSICLCGIVGGPIAGLILGHFDGALGIAGWRWLFLLEGIPSILLGGVVFWMPQLIKTAGVADTLNIGLLTVIPYVGAVIGNLLIGASSDRHGERRWHMAGCALLTAAGYLVCAVYPGQLTPLMIGMTMILTGIIAWMPIFWTIPPRFLSGMAAAAGIALINSLGQLGGVIAPFMVGRIKDLTGTATPALYLLGAVCLVAAALIIWGIPTRYYVRETIHD